MTQAAPSHAGPVEEASARQTQQTRQERAQQERTWQAHSAGTESLDGERLSRLIAAIEHTSHGTLTRLRRFHPLRQPKAVVFEVESVLSAAEISTADAATTDRWSLLLHCLALARARRVQRDAATTGRILARLPMSEMRLRQLLEADFDRLADLLPRLARWLDAASTQIDWQPLAELLLHTGTDAEARADRARRRIVRGYIGAPHRHRIFARR